MDIELIQNFKSTINQQLDELLISQIEQYRDELEKLNQNLEQTACMIKEKESLIQELQKQVDENKFEQSNFTNVSIIQNLNNQIKELSSKNALLETSLRLRQNAEKERFQGHRGVDEAPEPDDVEVEADNGENEPDNSEEAPQADNVPDENEHVNADTNEAGGGEPENPKDEPEEHDEEEEEGEEEEEEEEVQVVEIEHKRKTYYVQNNEVFQKKKDGSMGKKVGVMDGESVILDEKPKKDKKDKKGKKDGKKKKKNGE